METTLENLPGHAQVLIVDDEPMVANGFARLLRRRGHEVTTVSTAEDALRLILSRSFDVVVSDIRMPGCGGIEMLRAVRAIDADLPVILVTGSPNFETAVDAVDSGAQKYLLKPVTGGPRAGGG